MLSLRLFCWVFQQYLPIGKGLLNGRYPRLKLFLYFEESTLPKCTHFAVVNYDNQLSIVERKEEEDEGSGYDSDLAEKEEKR